MTLVSNDPGLWPAIDSYRISSYCIVVASVGLIYDWVLTFGQEVELVWRQRWSLMTVLYLSVRYVGISYAVISILSSVPTIPVTDAGCQNMYLAQTGMGVIAYAMLGVIMIARLHAMYQQSRKVLTFLVVIFLAVNIANGVMTIMAVRHISAGELVLFGTYECPVDYGGDGQLLASMTWILSTIWEVIALFFAVWIAVKHFRELRRQSAGGDYFTVLVKTHVIYFASFCVVSCFELGYFSPTLSTTYSPIYSGFSSILQLEQLFVLGPRLILSVREYHARLVTDSDAATAISSIAFQERVHVSTSSSV